MRLELCRITIYRLGQAEYTKNITSGRTLLRPVVITTKPSIKNDYYYCKLLYILWAYKPPHSISNLLK